MTLLIKHGLTHTHMVFKDLGGEAVAEMTVVIQGPESNVFSDCTVVKSHV